MKLQYLLVIAVVAGMIVLASQVNPNANKTFNEDSDNARKMIGTILENGGKAVFNPTLSPPTTEFTYKSVEQIITSSLTDLQIRELINQIPDSEYRNYILSLSSNEQKALFERIQNQETLDSQEQQILDAMNKQKAELQSTNQTETVVKEILTSEVELTNSDRQLGTTKICKIGNQCDISGTFLIIDNDGDAIPGPYGMFFSLDCESMEFCNLDPIGIQKTTNSDGTWMYSTTLSSAKYIPGEYTAFARATIISNDLTYWIEGSMIVEIIQ